MNSKQVLVTKKTEAETSIKLVEPNWVITIQHHTKGPLIKGSISGTSAEIFHDTGAMVNLSLRGVTGNELNTLGETRLTVTLTINIHITIPVISVEKSVFPGDLLVGFATMRVENITVSPAEHGAQIADVFLPFINPEVFAEPSATHKQRL